MKKENTTANVRNEATEAMVQEAAVNCIDKWAERIAGAKTPVNLKVSVSVVGSIGDVNANFTISGSLNNGVYRTKQHAKHNHHNKNHDNDDCKCEKQSHGIAEYDIVKGVLLSLFSSKKLEHVFYLVAKDGVKTSIDYKTFNCNMGKALLLEGLITAHEAAAIDAVLDHAPNSFSICMGNPWGDSYKATYSTYQCGRNETTKDFINRITKK